MFALCCRYCDHVLSLPAQRGAVFPVVLSVGRCGVARLQMKVGHMDGIHCFIDSTSVLVKIKSVSLYDCRTVYEMYKRLPNGKTCFIGVGHFPDRLKTATVM